MYSIYCGLMSSSSSFLPRQMVSCDVFEQLSDLLRQTVSTQSEEFHVITNESFESFPHYLDLATAQRFTLVVSQSFSGLLIGQGEGSDRPHSSTPHSSASHALTHSLISTQAYTIDLTFEPGAIASFMRSLAEELPSDSPTQHTLRQALTLLQTNSPSLQSEFTLRLVEQLTSTQLPSDIEPESSAKVLEEELTQRTQVLHNAMLAAQAADQAKSEFLAAMSHELRTPLTYILGMSATLLRWSSTAPEEIQQDDRHQRQHRYLQNIHKQGEHLLELINDILDLSQLESGKADLDLQEFSLSLLMQQTLKAYIDRAKEKNIRLEFDLQLPPELDMFTADPRRIRQVVLNLLSNAIKFTHAGGEVTLRVSATKHAVTLQVKDTGIGIPEHLQTDIFQKFRQLDASYHRQYEGTGLGLALTKQLVDLHGGRIECQSTPNVGTVFTVKLPRHPFTRSLAHQEPSAPDVTSQPLGRIVLIESHNENAHFISDMLTAAGYQLIWMLEGLTAVSQVELVQPALVMVGTHLPDSDSCDIVRQLRQNPLTKHLKIIAIGSLPAIYEQSSYENAGADEVLPYPVRPEELLHTVSVTMAATLSG